eukprot:6181791-Pleurochrysis_carterae.AAC.3
MPSSKIRGIIAVRAQSSVLNRKPVAYLTCNGSPPVGGKPSLMTFSEVERDSWTVVTTRAVFLSLVSECIEERHISCSATWRLHGTARSSSFLCLDVRELIMGTNDSVDESMCESANKRVCTCGRAGVLA